MQPCGLFFFSYSSLFDLLDLAPIDALFQHDLGRLDLGEGLEDAVACEEEDDHEEDAEKGGRVQPVSNVGVRVVDAFGLDVGEEKSHDGCE